MLGRLIIGPQTAVCADLYYRNKVIIPDATSLIYLFSICLLSVVNPPPLSLKMLSHMEPLLSFMAFFKGSCLNGAGLSTQQFDCMVKAKDITA